MKFLASCRFSLFLLSAAAVSLLPAAAAERQAAAVAPRAEPVSTGDIAPDFTLEGHDGRQYTLSARRGRGAVVLVFYRGYW